MQGFREGELLYVFCLACVPFRFIAVMVTIGVNISGLCGQKIISCGRKLANGVRITGQCRLTLGKLRGPVGKSPKCALMLANVKAHSDHLFSGA
jgi:hypothetical protein